MTNKTITINMNPKTVADLKRSGFQLYGFKAVKSTNGGGEPTVWFQSANLLVNTKISWAETYKSYISNNQIIANGIITASANSAIDLGQTMEVDTVGNVSVTNEGSEHSISIFNNSTTQYTTGIQQQLSNGEYSTLCAFPLYGNNLDVITPIDKVLLMFATSPVQTATVIQQAFGAGLLIDLTSEDSRTVDFDINKGWSWGNEGWGKSIPANSPLNPLLIES